MLRLRNLMLGLVMAAMSPSAAEASLILNLSESGGNTVLTYSGYINTVGLVPVATSSTTASSMQPSSGQIMKGPATDLFFTNSSSGFQPFGSGGLVNPISESGSAVLTNFGSPAILGLPAGYASGAPITGSMTFVGTFAALGITDRRSYTFSWGAGGAGSSVTLNVASAVPEPATMGVLAIGSVLGGYTYRRRSRKAKIQAAD